MTTEEGKMEQGKTYRVKVEDHKGATASFRGQYEGKSGIFHVFVQTKWNKIVKRMVDESAMVSAVQMIQGKKYGEWVTA